MPRRQTVHITDTQTADRFVAESIGSEWYVYDRKRETYSVTTFSNPFDARKVAEGFNNQTKPFTKHFLTK